MKKITGAETNIPRGKPWFKFFPASWRSDPALRSCSLAARGLWADMICLMDEGKPRGHLCQRNGGAISESSLARLVGRDLKEIRPALRELRAAEVFSLTSEGVIFSRRMVRDEQQARIDRANGRRGGNPQLTGRGVNRGDNGGENLTKFYPLQEGGHPSSKGRALEGDGPFSIEGEAA